MPSKNAEAAEAAQAAEAKDIRVTKDDHAIIASDLHIRSPEDSGYRLLLDAIDHVCEAWSDETQQTNGQERWFLLNGDIFDIFVGARRFYTDRFSELRAKLENLARVCRVCLIEGNHEFHLRKLNWKNVLVIEDELALTLPSGEVLLVCHGDLMIPDPWYAIYRWLLKSQLSLQLSRLIPVETFNGICLKYASHSRSKDEYRKLDHHRVLSHALAKAVRSKCDYLVFGHFHHPYQEDPGCWPPELIAPHGSTSSQLPKLIASVECWDSPNFLVFGSHGPYRLTRNSQGWSRSPISCTNPSILSSRTSF